jgi:aspartyl protease family protein
LLVAVAAAVPFAYRTVKAKIESGEPLTWSEKLAPLAGALEKEPCNRDKIVPFCDELIAEGEPRYCLKRADAFFKQCGEYLRLRWLTYESHKRLSEFDQAITEATMLVDAYPDDKDYRWWRGIAYEAKGDFAKAAEDYEQAVAIEPRLTGIPFNLAMAYQKLGRPCDGIFPLEQFTFHHPDVAQNARRRLTELYDDPHCQERAGTGRATVHVGGGSRIVKSKVQVNGRASGEMLIDTGASTVVLSRAFADKLGLDYSRWPQQRAITAAGIGNVRSGHLDEVTLQGLTAHHVECAVSDGLTGADGLLGLSFLSRFEMKMDPARGLLELEQKRR